mgnify:CR=1 FL=1
MNSQIDEIGFQGPFILTILIGTQLWNITPYFISYLVGFFINKKLNEILKDIFKEPRPIPFDLKNAENRDPLQFIGRALSTNKDKTYISKSHLYGMPSGHAQTASFVIAYYYFMNEKSIFKKINITTIVFLFALLIYFITIYQRWNSKAHTITQLMVGSIVGILFAKLLKEITEQIMRKKLTYILKNTKDNNTQN